MYSVTQELSILLDQVDPATGEEIYFSRNKIRDKVDRDLEAIASFPFYPPTFRLAIRLPSGYKKLKHPVAFYATSYRNRLKNSKSDSGKGRQSLKERSCGSTA